MLSKEIYTLDYITALQQKYKKDPNLLERVMYAFGLLEAICKVNMPFIFKGGTCLMLLTDTPMRLSTDIDIMYVFKISYPPFTPTLETMGIPALPKASISRTMVLADTSNNCDNFCAEVFPWFKR